MSSSRPDLSSVIVPEWVGFVAQDSDGSWWGYSVDPLQNHRGWYENELGRNVKLSQETVIGDWRDNLFTYPY